jgi:hypothetical protein
LQRNASATKCVFNQVLLQPKAAGNRDQPGNQALPPADPAAPADQESPSAATLRDEAARLQL